MAGDSSDVFVPITTINTSHNDSRLQELRQFFINEYGNEPEFFVKVPGRVNIIGEHVDYCGFPVLPMAIEQNILLAVSKTNDGFLHLRNQNKKYTSFKASFKNFDIDIPKYGSPEWSSYFLCGLKGVLEFASTNLEQNIGISVAINGNIPPASGLSSSSALVCSAVLATAFVLKVQLNSNVLATVAARCERYIGTQGGGMDQAIAFLAKSGCAQLIEFYPILKATSIRLPQDAYFVVANSLTEMNKAATSDFNQRVVECQISCRLLAKNMNFNNWKSFSQFAVLQDALQCSLEELERLANQIIHKDLYVKDDILKELSVTENELRNEFLTENTRNMETFKLRQRTLHVLQESLRVKKFRNVCEQNVNDIDALTKLMNQSHSSLRFLYECSHPNLEELIKISSEIGIGARLTGAGWGGCIVALCDSMTTCNTFIEAVKDKYYKNLPQAKDYNLDNLIFSTSPQSGAEIYILEK